MDIAVFLLERIAWDEAEARALADAYERDEVRPPGRLINFGALVVPRRVLAECEVKRRIIESRPSIDAPGHMLDTVHDEVQRQREHVFRLLALPYADHPDYDESWRP